MRDVDDADMHAYLDAYKASEPPADAAERGRARLRAATVSARPDPPSRRHTLVAAVLGVAATAVLFAGWSLWSAVRPDPVELDPEPAAAPYTARKTGEHDPARATERGTGPRPAALPGPEPPTIDAGPGDEAPRPPRPHRRRRASEQTSDGTTTEPAVAAPGLSAAEVRSFERAQATLTAGRYGDALKLLRDHGRRYPQGFFEEERLVSVIVALCRQGRTAHARQRAAAFVRARPKSNLLHRVPAGCAAR